MQSIMVASTIFYAAPKFWGALNERVTVDVDAMYRVPTGGK